jgi:hypothetical protein
MKFEMNDGVDLGKTSGPSWCEVYSLLETVETDSSLSTMLTTMPMTKLLLLINKTGLSTYRWVAALTHARWRRLTNVRGWELSTQTGFTH